MYSVLEAMWLKIIIKKNLENIYCCAKLFLPYKQAFIEDFITYFQNKHALDIYNRQKYFREKWNLLFPDLKKLSGLCSGAELLRNGPVAESSITLMSLQSRSHDSTATRRVRQATATIRSDKAFITLITHGAKQPLKPSEALAARLEPMWGKVTLDVSKQEVVLFFWQSCT